MKKTNDSCNAEVVFSVEERDAWLQMPAEELLRHCRRDTMRGTGPGGQKRNKTESAVRLVHLPTGIAATDDVTRSQHQNCAAALEKIRLALAMELRGEYTPLKFREPTKQQLPLWIAHALDALEKNGMHPAAAAEEMGCTTSHFLKMLNRMPAVWQKVCSERQRRQLPALHL